VVQDDLSKKQDPISKITRAKRAGGAAKKTQICVFKPSTAPHNNNTLTYKNMQQQKSTYQGMWYMQYTLIFSLLFQFWSFNIIILGVHCDIYQSSYNTSSLDLLPPSFSYMTLTHTNGMLTRSFKKIQLPSWTGVPSSLINVY
jgi:hypothetical protein